VTDQPPGPPQPPYPPQWFHPPQSPYPAHPVPVYAVGLVLGMKALRLAKIGFISDRGLAIAGVVLSCVGIATGVVFAAVFGFAVFGG